MSNPSDARDPLLRSLTVPGIILWAIGAVLMFYPTLTSGFDRIVGRPGDPRLVTYLLEHTYRWIRGMPLHENLWHPPFYFPATNTFALSDTLLGIAPLYWVWRIVGASPEGALQAFLLSASTLTFVATLVLFGHTLRREPMAAAAGAFLFAFGAPRIIQLHHVQLIPHFYLPLMLIALIRMVSSERRETLWSAVFVGSLMLQLYAAFYYAWFAMLAFAIAILVAMLDLRARNTFARTIRLNAIPMAAFGLAAALLVLPLAVHYLDAARLVGQRDWGSEIAPGLPLATSWLFVGSYNLLYGVLMSGDLFAAARSPEGMLGVGFVTLATAIAGHIVGRRDRAIMLIGVTGAILIVISTTWIPGWNAWRLIYELVPAASAIRAVSRIGLVVLLAIALGFTVAVERLGRRSRLAGALVVSLAIVEQIQLVPSVDKREVQQDAARIAASVPADCPSFYVALWAPDTSLVPYRPWKYHLDAMAAQLELGIPTVNGYSGWMPPDWSRLYDNTILSLQDTSEVRARIREWNSSIAPPCIIAAPFDTTTASY